MEPELEWNIGRRCCANTDGAVEGVAGRETGTVGAVLLEPKAKVYAYVAAELGQSAMRDLVSSCAAPIVAVELLAVLLAFFMFEEALSSRSAIIFVDNDAGRQALIKGYSRCPIACALVERICKCEVDTRALTFFERVPSASNIADAPSRGAAPASLDSWAGPHRLLSANLVGGAHRFFRGLRDTHF